MQVSIIIPTYNYATFIPEAINSLTIKKSSNISLQVLVIDDGSTDNTRDILNPYIEKGIIEYLFTPNRGKAEATLLGIQRARGEIIFTLDADGTFLPGKIEDTVNLFSMYPQVMHVASPALIRWEDSSRPDEKEVLPGWLTGKRLNGQDVLRNFMEKKMLFGGGSTFAVRKSVLKTIAFPPGVDMYTDEWLVINALLAGETYFFPEPLSVWRIHGGNYSVQQQKPSKLAIKHQRLQASSLTILRVLENNEYPVWLKRAYRLKHETRCMVWKEQQGLKTMADRWHFLAHCLWEASYPLYLWRSYRVLNRILF